MGESDDLRTFVREVLLRYDRGIAAMYLEQRAHRDESRKYFEELHAQGERESRRIDDVIAENRAQRAALLGILDQLRGKGGTAPAG